MDKVMIFKHELNSLESGSLNNGRRASELKNREIEIKSSNTVPQQ